MKLSISKSKNSIIYYVAETLRNGKQTSTRIVTKIGTHADLLMQGIDDPLQYAKDYVSKINHDLQNNIIPYNEKIDLKEELDSNSISSEATFKNIGWIYLLNIYNQLGIKDFVNSIPSKAKYNVNDIIKFLSISRILNPCSKKATYESKNRYLFSPEYNLIDSYRVLELLSKNNNLLQKTLYENTQKTIDLDTDILYYDCTNFYWETETEDDNLYNEDGDIIQWGLRRYGVSKEHRPSPIVNMGLFINKDGIPISYGISPGNTNEQTTAIPLEKQMISQYKNSNFIYCSDAGLGSYDIRFFNSLNNRRYLVTQSLKKIDEDNSDLIFKDLNWKFVTPRHKNDGINGDITDNVSLNEFKAAIDKKINGEELTTREQELLKRDMIYKVFPITRDVPIKFIKDLGIKLSGKLQMDELIYITFSQKYYIYQKEIFNRQLDRAKQIVVSNKNISKKKTNDPKRLISEINTTKNGEVACEKVNVLNTELILEEEKYHGFYALATNLDKDINELLQINAQRWKIEQSFRILKTDFDARPAFVWNEEHIKGHFAICYISLLIFRILENKLINCDCSYHFSSSSIIKTLNNINVIEKGNDLYQSLYTGSKILDALNKTFSLDLNKKYYRKSKIDILFK